MDKKTSSKKSDKPDKPEKPSKSPSRRANGTGFFHEFNPGQTRLLHELADEYADEISLETVMRGEIPNCRFDTKNTQLEAYITYELEKLGRLQQTLEGIFENS